MKVLVKKLSSGQEMIVFVPEYENPYISAGVLVDALDFAVPGVVAAFTPSNGVTRAGLWWEGDYHSLSDANIGVDIKSFDVKTQAQELIDWVMTILASKFPFFSDVDSISQFLKTLLAVPERTDKVISWMMSVPWYRLMPLIRSNVVSSFCAAKGSGLLGDDDATNAIFNVLAGQIPEAAPNLGIKTETLNNALRGMAKMYAPTTQGAVQSVFAQRMLVCALALLRTDSGKIQYYVQTEDEMKQIDYEELARIINGESNPIADYVFETDANEVKELQVALNSADSLLGDW